MKRLLTLTIALAVAAIVITGCTPTPAATPTVKPTVMASPTMMPSPSPGGDNTGDAIREAVESVAGVSEAAVAVMGNKALVGVKLVDGTTLSDSTKPNIESAAKSADTDLTTVYVTADATLFDEIKSLAGQITETPSEGITGSFNDIADRIEGKVSSPSPNGTSGASPLASPTSKATSK